MNEAASQTMTERGLRPALTPQVEVTSFQEGGDLEYKMAVELLPEIAPPNFAELALERLKVAVTDEEVDTSLDRMAKGQLRSEKIEEARPAANGDVVIVDFTGKLDGKVFPGGSGTGARIELGAKQFIPGFEEQIVGHNAGESFDITVTFPADYTAKDLAGKEAVFSIVFKELHRKIETAPNDEWAKAMGFDRIDDVKKTVRDQIGREYTRMARLRLKRQLLDKLAEMHSFAVPDGMVDLEYQAIRQSIDAERKRGTDDPSISGKSDEQLSSEFRPIAERRVRLGLLLSEVGRANNLTVSQEEINRAMIEEARRFPGQERKVVEFYRNNEQAQAQLRAPLFEDKVVDFILEMAKITDKAVTPDELTKAAEADEAAPAR
jgi:trigger factor